MLDVLKDLVGTLLGAWLGAYFGYRFSIKQAQAAESSENAVSQDAYLRHLMDEFTHNRRILRSVKDSLSGPPVENLWTPAATAVTHLRLQAWDQLLCSGVLPLLAPTHQQTLGGADRAVRDAKRVIQTFEAKWRKVGDWAAWDRATENPQPLTTWPIVKDQWLTEASEEVDRAIYLLGQAIGTLPSVTDDDASDHVIYNYEPQ